MSEVERLSAWHGLCRLEVHAAPDSVPFYEKLGWVMVDAGKSCPLMARDISSRDDSGSGGGFPRR
ncbi:GNAT family N-acetyltransferase [Rhizobium etli]|uniref:GNAT family N-acetyltransferase n=1 Tax=Rhizobium etli TaxID=29449 RepID=UPI00040A7075|nr:GNAT family N-acetyltransferase [Rhizobium etli]